jgi:hypothetical protein
MKGYEKIVKKEVRNQNLRTTTNHTMNNKPIPKEITDELFFTFETLYTKTKLENIAERYGFSEKLEAFSKMVEETFYGERPVSELTESLVKEIGVSEEVAQYIAIGLDQEIFSENRLEFNVVQGLVSMDEIERVSTGNKSAHSSASASLPKKGASDPVASSVFEGENPPEKKRDLYREPIEE